MHSIRANKTWDLVELPKNQRALPCKLVYRLKEMFDSTNPKYKARNPKYKADCRSVSTPLDRTVKLHLDSGKVCDPTRFRQIVRSLIYLTITRPDLSYPVGVINQLMARPTEEHLQCAQRVVRYVSGTKDRGLLYWTGTAAQLVGYTDVDWAGNATDRQSTFGYAFSLGSAAIAWSSKKQPIVALSST